MIRSDDVRVELGSFAFAFLLPTFTFAFAFLLCCSRVPPLYIFFPRGTRERGAGGGGETSNVYNWMNTKAGPLALCAPQVYIATSGRSKLDLTNGTNARPLTCVTVTVGGSGGHNCGMRNTHIHRKKNR